MTFAKTFKNAAFAPAIAAAALVSFAGAAHADEGYDADIVVTSQAEMVAWQKDATATLNRSLAKAESARSAVPSDGIVQLTFEMGADGNPTNIEVLSSNANWAAERAARRAVRRLGNISDVPVTNADGARFLANIVFADTVEQHAELTQELEKSMSEGFASGENNYIVLGG